MLTYAEAQPLARELANKLRSRMTNQPGTHTPDPKTSHPLTFRAIQLSERLAVVVRNSCCDDAADGEITPEQLAELEAIAAQCQAEGIE